jgi:hypothetical protein
MQVILKSAQKLGLKTFNAGEVNLPDALCGDKKFIALVKSGQIVMPAKDASGVQMQKSKDQKAATKAEAARKLGLELAAAKKAGATPLDLSKRVKA